MVGTRAMAPERIELNGRFRNDEQRDEERERIMKRFETIGVQILNRTGGGDPMHHDPISSVLADRDKQCAIPEGTASPERGRMLRREGLELALYTFTYMKQIDSVFEFMPAPLGKKPTSALFFRRADLEQALARPLNATLPAQPPFVSNTVSPAEVANIDRLTARNQFTYAFGQLKDGSAAALLTPIGS